MTKYIKIHQLEHQIFKKYSIKQLLQSFQLYLLILKYINKAITSDK